MNTFTSPHSFAVPRCAGSPAVQDPERIKLSWLVKLHWGAIVAQAALILGVHVSRQLALPLAPLFALVALEIVLNGGLEIWLRRPRPVPEALVAGVMIADAIVLTGLLHLSGGHFNPFSTMYLVNVALAAVLLQPRWSWAQVVVSLLAFGALFPLQELAPFGVREHEAMMKVHLEGMWVALALAALLIVWIVQRVTRALGERERELAEARALSARRENLASLATLAAGAAHELLTPLSTIVVVVKELERELAGGPATPEAATDLELIRSQAHRCRDILRQMAGQAGQNVGETLRAITLTELLSAALDGLPGRELVEVPVANVPSVQGPPSGLARALRCLMRNALQASAPGQPVIVRAALDAGAVRIEVIDRGVGMTPEVLARAGEPFFSTKPAGEGTGLGLFLTRSLIEQLGGRLELASIPGRGTTAAIVVPPA